MMFVIKPVIYFILIFKFNQNKNVILSLSQHYSRTGRPVQFVGFVMLRLICKLKCVQRVRYKTKVMRSLIKVHYFRSPSRLCF